MLLELWHNNINDVYLYTCMHMSVWSCVCMQGGLKVTHITLYMALSAYVCVCVLAGGDT